MDYPNIPTDNLYKFIALGGLALVIFSVTYPTNKALELRLNTIEIRAQVAKLGIELENLKRQVTRVEEKKVEERTEVEILSLRQTLTEQSIKSIDIQSSVGKAETQTYWFIAYSVAAILGFVLGTLAAHRGFYLWYLRVQLPNDQKNAGQKGDA